MLEYYGSPTRPTRYSEGGWLEPATWAAWTRMVTSLPRTLQGDHPGRRRELPEEVEGILYEHPAVEQVVLVGMPDETHGEGWSPSSDQDLRTLDAEVRDYLGGKVADSRFPGGWKRSTSSK